METREDEQFPDDAISFRRDAEVALERGNSANREVVLEALEQLLIDMLSIKDGVPTPHLSSASIAELAKFVTAGPGVPLDIRRADHVITVAWRRFYGLEVVGIDMPKIYH